MLNSITIRRFKSLRDVTVTLGRFNVLIGANASGKSNFLEALRVLEGIGRGYTIDEILNGKSEHGMRIWEGIRGGSSSCVFNASVPRGERALIVAEGGAAEETADDGTFEIEVTTNKSVEPSYVFKITIHAERNRVVHEELLQHDGENSWMCYRTTNQGLDDLALHVIVRSDETGHGGIDDVKSDRPVLMQLLPVMSDEQLRKTAKGDSIRFIIKNFIQIVSNAVTQTQWLQLDPNVLRKYSNQSHADRVGEHGENFAAVVNGIVHDPDQTRRSNIVSWLEELASSEVTDIDALPGAAGDCMFAIQEGDVTRPAIVLSEGTLRFSALVVALFQDWIPEMLLVEEIENGIHPARMRLLVELLSVNATDRSQVIVTTHSPLLLGWLETWLEKRVYDTVFLFARDEQGASTVRSVNEVPHFLDIVTKHPLEDMFAEGWLEHAL